MKPLGRRARSVLLGFHIFFAASWMGGVIALIVLSLVGWKPSTDGALAFARDALHWIDVVVIIPACLGSLATGFLFALLTNWGFFQQRWLVIKWTLTTAMILFGIFFLGPWVDETATRAARDGVAALDDAAYSETALRVLAFSIVQIVLLVFMVFLSTLKPFGKRGARAPTS